MHFLSKYPNSAVIFASFIWGTYWIPLRYINQNGNESVWPLFFAFGLLSLILIKTIINLITKLFYKNDRYFILGNFFAALAMALYSESLLRGEIAEVVILFYLCPVWGTIFAKIFLKQNFNLQRYISLILGLIGLEIILGFDQGYLFPNSYTEWIAIFAGLSWSLGITFFHLSKPSSVIDKTAFTSFIMAFIFLFISFIPGGREVNFEYQIYLSSNLLIWIALFSFCWLLPSMYLTYISAEILDPGRINILLMFEVIIGISTAALLTNEVIGIREVIGAVIVIFAGTIDLIKFNNFIRN